MEAGGAGGKGRVPRALRPWKGVGCYQYDQIYFVWLFGIDFVCHSCHIITWMSTGIGLRVFILLSFLSFSFAFNSFLFYFFSCITYGSVRQFLFSLYHTAPCNFTIEPVSAASGWPLVGWAVSLPPPLSLCLIER